jgi:hypothetical protein
MLPISAWSALDRLSELWQDVEIHLQSNQSPIFSATMMLDFGVFDD